MAANAISSDERSENMKIPKITPLKIGAAGIFTAAMLIAADRIMDIQLHRGGYPDRRFSVNKRFTDFGRTRKTVRFSSGDNVLKGYIYGGVCPRHIRRT